MRVCEADGDSENADNEVGEADAKVGKADDEGRQGDKRWGLWCQQHQA